MLQCNNLRGCNPPKKKELQFLQKGLNCSSFLDIILVEMKNQSQNNYTPYQLKLPVDLERIIEISDPVYTFCDVVDHIDLPNSYLLLKNMTVSF